MTYEQALSYIHSIAKRGDEPALYRVKNLLRELGNPEREMKYVHVAGTNGKGSTTALCASVLSAAGYKTGMFISPYLERFNERMQIGGEPIADERLAALTERVKSAAEAVAARGIAPPSEFSFLTAEAFRFWAEERCDFVSLEVGMGGRLDATNVIPPPEAAIIASISLEHTRRLGSTTTAIAYEKCGIVKPGAPVVCYAEQDVAARRVIENVCDARGAQFIQPDPDAVRVERADLGGSRFRYGGLDVELPLVGRHQIMNALGAIEAMRALRARGYATDDSAIVEGIARTNWVGRLETVRREPLVLLDAAHNPDAARTLGRAIDELLGSRRLVVVMGMLADKDYNSCIPEIAKRADAFVACTPECARALPADACAAVARQVCKNVETVEGIGEAVWRALALAEPGDAVLICGSLYVIGAARTRLREIS